MKRRTFIRNTAIGGFAVTLPSMNSFAEVKLLENSIPRRKLGRADDKLSILGFGGIMLNKNTQEFANENIAKSFDNGINYFDTILFPFNFVCWNTGNFGPKVYEKAKQRNMGILALKSMALTTLKKGEEKVYPNCWYRPVMDDETLNMAFRYTLSMDITAAVSPGESKLFWKGVDMARHFTPINENEREKLVALAKITEPVFKT